MGLPHLLYTMKHFWFQNSKLRPVETLNVNGWNVFPRCQKRPLGSGWSGPRTAAHGCTGDSADSALGSQARAGWHCRKGLSHWEGKLNTSRSCRAGVTQPPKKVLSSLCASQAGWCLPGISALWCSRQEDHKFLGPPRTFSDLTRPASDCQTLFEQASQ